MSPTDIESNTNITGSISTMNNKYPLIEKGNDRSKPEVVIIQHGRRIEDGYEDDSERNYRDIEQTEDQNTKNDINFVECKKKRKDKMEWEASVVRDTKLDAVGSFQDTNTKALIHSSQSNIMSCSSSSDGTCSDDGDGGENSFSFRLLKKQRNDSMNRLIRGVNDGSNNNSMSYQSTTSDGSDFSGTINSNNKVDRSELREDLTAQVSARFFDNQDDSIRDDVRISIRRAISRNGLHSVDEEKIDKLNNDKGIDDDSVDTSNADESKNSEDETDIKVRRLKQLKNSIISRRGCIVFLALSVCLLIIGNIVVIVLWALKQ